MMTALRQSRSQTPAQVEKTVANGDRPRWNVADPGAVVSPFYLCILGKDVT